MGQVWVSMRDLAFPSVEWEDRPVRVVSYFAQAVLGIEQLLRGRSSSPARLAEGEPDWNLVLDEEGAARAHFCEGPYFVRMVGRESGRIRIEARRRSETREGVVVDSFDVELAELVSVVLQAGQETIRICEASEFDGVDVESLRARVTYLNRIGRM